MTDLTPERLAELRRIAEAATPGPWAVNPWQAVVDEMETLTPICGMLWPTELRTEEQTLANAQHIATFDPTTVLALLDALDAARAETERLRVELELAREVVEAFRSMVYRYQWAHQFQGVDVVAYRARDAERVKKALCRYDDSRRGGKS